MKKMLMAVVAIVLIVVISVSATFAYLTAKDEVVNTFTIGDVQIKLDETDVDLYGEKDGETRVKTNAYKLLPGHTYIKDPTVTVIKESEPAYVRMLVTVSDMTKLTAAFPAAKFPGFYGTDGVFLLQNLVEGWNNTVWAYEKFDTDTYEFRYTKIVDTRTAPADEVLPALFTKIVMPDEIDNAGVAALDGVQIKVVAQAIQADGFANADAAWAEFVAPVEPAPVDPAPAA